MKQRNNTLISSGISAFLAVMCLFVACNSNPEEFSFKNPQEAVKACHTELSNIRPIRKANIEELTMLASRWIALQDSTYSLIYRDSTIDINSEVNIDFFMVADSIREELTRLAVSEKRSLRDVVYFKIHTARDAGHLKQSKDYKNAVKFYDGLNSAELYPDIDNAELSSLLTSIKNQEEELEMKDKEIVRLHAIIDRLTREVAKNKPAKTTKTTTKTAAKKTATKKATAAKPKVEAKAETKTEIKADAKAEANEAAPAEEKAE